jgi:hypothetical protein
MDPDPGGPKTWIPNSDIKNIKTGGKGYRLALP